MSWNMRCATRRSRAWEYFAELDPDVALLQEVSSIPDPVVKAYSIHGRKAVTKFGNRQRFGTYILAREAELIPFRLRSEVEWVDDKLQHFAGNLVACRTELFGRLISIVSVHSPAWPLDREEMANLDVSGIKLEQNPDVWVTELLWAAVRQRADGGAWIVGGDLNSSETFDEWPGGPRGNLEILKRMSRASFTELLRHYQGRLTPTFTNSKNGKVIHQLDHLFVTEELLDDYVRCDVADQSKVFDGGLSDHLPVVADFRR